MIRRTGSEELANGTTGYKFFVLTLFPSLGVPERGLLLWMHKIRNNMDIFIESGAYA